MIANASRRLALALCAVCLLHFATVTPAQAQSAGAGYGSLNDLQLDQRDRLVLESLANRGEVEEVVFDVLRGVALRLNGLPDDTQMLVGVAKIYADAFGGDIDAASRGIVTTIEAMDRHRLLIDVLDDAHGPVGRILTRADDLNKQQEFVQARWTLRWALEDMKRLVYEDTEGFRRMMDALVLQARLEFRPEDAIFAEIMSLRADQDEFSSLIAAQRRYVENGHLKDLRFDVVVALGLNRRLVKMARTLHERSIALNELANALRSLAEMQPGTELLEEAILAYRAALKDSDLFNDPLDWATSQHNLGYALWMLASRSENASSLYLAQSVDAYRAALGYRSRDLDSRAWGLTQNNLGVSLFDLAKISRGTDELLLAIEAFNATLGVFDPQESIWKVAAANLRDANNLLVNRNSSN